MNFVSVSQEKTGWKRSEFSLPTSPPGGGTFANMEVRAWCTRRVPTREKRAAAPVSTASSYFITIFSFF